MYLLSHCWGWREPLKEPITSSLIQERKNEVTITHNVHFLSILKNDFWNCTEKFNKLFGFILEKTRFLQFSTATADSSRSRCNISFTSSCTSVCKMCDFSKSFLYKMNLSNVIHCEWRSYIFESTPYLPQRFFDGAKSKLFSQYREKSL